MTCELLKRAEKNRDYLIPVVFHLSFWTVKHTSFADWLIEELQNKYEIPEAVAQAWIDTNRLAILLDGLDEMSDEARPACLKGIIKYHQEQKLTSLVICCRKNKYFEQPTRIAFQKAVLIRPLTREQMHRYLFCTSGPIEVMQKALGDDPELEETIQTPLMLGIVAQTYQGYGSIILTGSKEERRRQIFTLYVQRMLSRRRGAQYPSQQTTPSRFPMPPTEATPGALCGTAPRETQEIPGESALEGEGERKRREREPNPEEKQKEEEELPPGITRFPQLPPPAAPSVPSDRFSPIAPDASEAGRSVPSPSLPSSDVPVHQVAEILRLPVSGALTRLVTEYTTFGSLALLGEADAAREWIDDGARNRSKKRMTVAFFRRWLKREQEMAERRHTAQASQAMQMSIAGPASSSRSPGNGREGRQPGGGQRLPGLMYLAEEDQQARGGRC